MSVDTQHNIKFTAEEQAWIDSNRKVIIGGTLDWPPLYFSDDDGNYVGLADDYLQLLAEITGLEFEIYIDEWATVINKFRRNEIDMISSIYKTEERLGYMAFSKPYLEFVDYFFIRSDSTAKTLDDLNGKVVSIPAGYAQINHVKKHFPDLNILIVDNLHDSIEAVVEGRADMLYGTYSTLSYELQLSGIYTIVPFQSTRELGTNTVHFVTQKSQPLLTSIIDKALTAIPREQQNAIYVHWFGKLAEVQQPDLLLTEQEQQWLKQHPKILFTGDPSWLPYEAFDQNGNYIGIVAEYLKIIEKKLAIEFEIVSSSSWTESVGKIRSGEVDVISETTDSELQGVLSFTESYLSSPIVIIARSDENYVASIDQIVNRKIAVISDYGYVTSITEAYPSVKFIEVDNIKAGLLDVSTGKVDILLATLAQASYNISKLGVNNVNIVGSTEFSTKLSFGVRKDFEPLIPLINKALNSISQAEHQQIMEAWGDDKFVARVDYALVASVAGILLFVIAVIIFWNRKLAEEIKLRKVAEQEAKSAQYDLKEQISLNQLIIDSVPTPLFYKDAQCKFSGFNRAFEETFAVNGEDLIGLTVEQLNYFSEEDLKAYHAEDLEVIKFQKSLKKEIQIPFADGQLHDILYWVSGFANSKNEPAGLVGNFIDISAEKENARRLELALKTADEANRAKADFLANMSHEIRTPMNAIIGLSELALKTDLNRKQHNYIEKVNRSAELLLGIINDILDFSKIEAGMLDLEQVSFQLASVFENLASLLTLKSEKKSLELLFDIDPGIPKSLIGDPLRLGQVLINLGGNALKFTEQGEIIISAQVKERTDNYILLQFSVKDTGIGMTPEQQQSLFLPFSQADNSISRKYGGTGLGLTISKRITEIMNGDIWVDSVSGQGSCFNFTAHFGIDTEQVSDDIFQKQDLNNLSVLVVDDNSSAREVLSNILSGLNFSHQAVDSGSSAIELLKQAKLKEQPFDLILMDWQMPTMNGIECAKQIHHLFGKSAPNIILVTAFGREEAYLEAKHVNFSGILTKPVTSSTLLDAINSSQGKGTLLKSREQQENQQLAEVRAKLNGSKILLVEDDEINQELAVELLVTNGMSVVVAEHGEVALSKLANESFDGVLMDCQMPVMDGFTATAEIRKQAKFSQLPILAMTANAMVGDKAKVIAAGMNDHIAKPINVKLMLETMAKWISPSNIRNDAAQSNIAVPCVTEQTIALGNIYGLDSTAGLAICQGNTNLYQRLLGKFYQKQHQFIDQFKILMGDNDIETAERVAHTLKGLAGNLGACAVFKAAGELEVACHQGKVEEIERHLLALDKQFAPLLKDLNQFIIQAANNNEENLSVSLVEGKLPDLAKVEYLKELLNDDDAEATEVILDITAVNIKAEYSLPLNKASEAISEFEFDKALVIVDKILVLLYAEASS